ncbi:MAG: YkgJ family cysteine cluster protein [Desulfobulbaceae bacterium]|uniref:YkgJ family cysteine cluster protein n=1 Tax=Candidatus Desulfobia pelagia TaxID=2841692 RepID=A0A8J6TGA8_9BACT|nr:YkgJ family cysteine cluster protein [Candidatus Desulfobia pelagia]
MADKNKTLFGFDTNPTSIIPKKYTLDSKIHFRCHPGVSCFTACCGHIDIILTPFDILRLRKHVNLSADEFLLRFTTPTYVEKTDLPGVKIHLDKDGRCPFVTDEGCTIYSERPSACRYYPIGMANFHEGGQEGIQSEKFFFIVKEDHCKGHEEETEWTIKEWRADQGVDLCDQMNKEWLEIVMRRRSFGQQASMSEQAQKMFFMASTDTDKFRNFVFNSSFLDTYDVDQETLDKIKEDDIEMMLFSFRYLASALFGTQDLQIKEEKIKERVSQIDDKKASAEVKAEETYKELLDQRDMLAESLKNNK